MSFSLRMLLGAGLALALATTAGAQTELGGLGDVDPFGRGYLEAGEPAMPTGMWRASRTEDLLPLIREVRTRQLTPAERTLLRRVVLSPAARPEGEQANAVLAERARILFELGEARAASDLLGRLEENPPGLDAAELSVDLQLALGNAATACASLTTETREGPYWAKLRAVCAVLSNNAPAAELAVELALAQGVNDPWFADAVFAASLEEQSELPARYDSGLNLALSTHLKLLPPDDTVTASRPDLASAMVARTSLPIAVRVPAAGVAAESGLLDGRTHRQLYAELVRQEGYEPARVIENAVAAMENANETDAVRAQRLEMALRASSANPARFLAAAKLFETDLLRVVRNPETARFAPIFARAEIALGRYDQAAAWLRVTAPEDAPEADVFDRAYLDAVLLLADFNNSAGRRAEVATRLVETAETPQARALAARLFALWTARNIAPPAPARALMAQSRREAGGRGDEWRMLAIRAAAEADAAGEVVVATLALTLGDPTGLATPDTLVILDSLRSIGADDAARVLAMEASGYWKAPRER